MNLRIRAAIAATLSIAAMGAFAASGAQANVLSLLGGNCGNQPEAQVFAPWGDSSEYTPVAGGSFESGTPSWVLTGGAATTAGNETYQVGSADDSRSLSIPAGATATSLPSCTNIYHPTLRLFVRNTGSPASGLKIEALYPGLLGGVNTATLATVSGTPEWAPTNAMPLLVSNLMATLSLSRTVIAFRFVPTDASGSWSIDDVYLDPFGRG